MNRRFICTRVDLDKFDKGMQQLYEETQRLWSLREFFERSLSYKLDEIENVYRHEVYLDATTWECIDKALNTLSFIDLHYAMHHIIWQILEVHKQGLVRLRENDRAFCERVTRDCIEKDNEYTIAA